MALSSGTRSALADSVAMAVGHAAFMAIGAYTVGILTLSAQLQRNALPELPTFLAGLEWTSWPALAVAAVVGAVIGLISGATLLRLSGSAATIATLAFLIIIYTLLAAAREVTRGSQPFYGVPRNAGCGARCGSRFAVPVVKAYIAAVVGGLGSLPGAVVGGLLLGAIEIGLDAVLPPSVVPYRDVFVLSGVILILLFPPQGVIPAASVRRG